MPTFLETLAGDPELEALLSDRAQVEGVLRFETALAQTQAELGMIAPSAAAAIIAAVAKFEPDWPDLLDGMARDGVFVPALIAQLRATIPEAYRASLHDGATSQDAIDTALMLALSEILPVLLARIASLRSTLGRLTEQFGDNRIMAHTRMQAALPFTVRAKISIWDDALDGLAKALSQMSPELLVVQLGGPIGDRSSLRGQGDALAAGVAYRLGLRNAQAWHTIRDRIVGLGSHLAMLSGAIGKIGADIGLMAQTEVGAVSFRIGGTSSALPHKSNPVLAEVLVALAHHAAGLAGTLHHAMVQENERSGAGWTLEWLTLPQLIIAAGASLRTADTLLNLVVQVGD